jgi:hypothetical protein
MERSLKLLYNAGIEAAAFAIGVWISVQWRPHSKSV